MWALRTSGCCAGISIEVLIKENVDFLRVRVYNGLERKKGQKMLIVGACRCSIRRLGIMISV